MFRHFPWLLLSPDGDGSSSDKGDSHPPKSDDPEGDSSLVTKKFDEGYGRGIRKGRKEGRSEGVGYALSELGFDGKSIDEAKAVIKEIKSNRKKQSDAKPADVDVTATPEYKSIAKELRIAGEQIQKLQSRSEKLEVYEAKALDSAIKEAFVRNGVATDTRLDAIVKLTKGRFAIGQDGNLEVLDKMSDGSMVNTGVAPDKFVKELLKQKDNQWALASNNVSGAGSGNENKTTPKTTDPNAPRPYSVSDAIAAYSGIKRQGDAD